MRKRIGLLILGVMFAGILQAQTGFYDFKVTDIDGKEFDMSSLKGKKVLVVNVASKCGLTPQYVKLQELYEKYGDDNFVIIGFPANNFLGQEPGTNAEIKEFCSLNYKVTFPLMSKIDVIGENKAPIYRWLTEKTGNGKTDAEVQWNFQKFMIDENGNWVDFVPPREDPFCEKIVNWIDAMAQYEGKPFGNERFSRSPQTIPGRVMCARFDFGGEGVSWHETTEANMGSGRYNPVNGTYLNEFRINEGVDISYTKVDMDYTDKNKFIPEQGMFYIGWTVPGEWVKYTVEITETGIYSVNMLYSAADDGSISLSLDDQDLAGELKLLSTTSPHIWNHAENLAEVKLVKGTHTLTLHTKEKGGMNYAWFDFIQKK